MSINIDQPPNTTPLDWQPSGIFAAGPSGPQVTLAYSVAKYGGGPAIQGVLPTAATITADHWKYPSQAQWQTDLTAAGFAPNDVLTLTAQLRNSSFVVQETSLPVTGGMLPPTIYPPMNTVIPDVAAALTVRLKRAPQIQALCSDRVSIVLKKDWQMPKYAIVVSGVGGSGPDQELDRHFARLDVRCFGPGDDYNVRQRNAMTLWRTAHPVLVPPVGLRISMAFHAAHCIVQNVRQDLEPMRLTEPGTDWPIVLVSYVVSFMASSV